MNINYQVILIFVFLTIDDSLSLYDQGCECGKRNTDVESEKDCMKSALLESADNVSSSCLLSNLRTNI